MGELKPLPEKFSDLITAAPAGIRISGRVLAPAIRIAKHEARFQGLLGGYRTVKGSRRFIAAPSNFHNWVLDEDTARPLPGDIIAVVNTEFPRLDFQDLSFANVLAVARRCQDLVAIELDNNVLIPAANAAREGEVCSEIPGLDATLYPYQAQGVAWMDTTIRHTAGLILADEMGLGKTIQIIALLLLQRPRADAPALIVCPTSLIANWRREIFRFAPNLSVLLHRGSGRTGSYRQLQTADVIVSTYETVVNDISLFSSLTWSWLICDEAQAIKNPDSQRRKALASVPRERTIPMTGTPVENKLLDLWSLADFAIPGLLSDRRTFEATYPDTESGAQALRAITDPIVLKRTIAEVADDLPERIDIDIPIEMDHEGALEYERIRVETLEKYPLAGALVATGQLQLYTAHPWLRATTGSTDDQLSESTVVPSSAAGLFTPKMERATSLIRDAFSSGRKVLVFAAFNGCAALIREALGDSPSLYWNTVNGSTAQGERQQIIDEFTAHDGNACLVLNPRAAGTGLNITAATVVIHFTLAWNPAIEAQASARAHRRGQTEPVYIYRLYYENTVEQVMIERSEWKRNLADKAVPLSSRENADLRRALEISPKDS